MPSKNELAMQLDTAPEILHFRSDIRNIAHDMVEHSGHIKHGQTVLVYYDMPNPLANEIRLRCLAKGAKVKLYGRSFEQLAADLPGMGEAEIREYTKGEEEAYEGVDFVFYIGGAENQTDLRYIPAEQMSLYVERKGEIMRENFNKGAYVYTKWPTKREAAEDGLSYEESVRAYIEGCKHSWEEIEKVQAILIKKLNEGKKLTFIANKDDLDVSRRTVISMSIEDMTFINLTNKQNYPGSEVCSAPVLNSVEGQVYAPGKYIYHGRAMENIRLQFKDGKVVKASAEKGDEGLHEILDMDEGARYVGEIAFGTNSGLQRRFINELLCEKTAGSFHFALGNCYDITEYNGEPVNVNNGNTEDKTSNHWDITILMHESAGGGVVILDGEILQIDGFFIDPELSILNPKINKSAFYTSVSASANAQSRN
jgi:aminopeptidase